MRIEDFVDRNLISDYFILDSHDKGVGGQNGIIYEDEDYIKYSYEPSQNNKLVPRSAFLYRKPGSDFRLIGGGIIERISDTDSNGYNTAIISHGFEFVTPIKKGDSFLENFHWKKKGKYLTLPE